MFQNLFYTQLYYVNRNSVEMVFRARVWSLAKCLFFYLFIFFVRLFLFFKALKINNNVHHPTGTRPMTAGKQSSLSLCTFPNRRPSSALAERRYKSLSRVIFSPHRRVYTAQCVYSAFLFMFFFFFLPSESKLNLYLYLRACIRVSPRE